MRRRGRSVAWAVFATVAGVAAAEEPDGFTGVVALSATGVDRPYVGASSDHSLAPIIIGQWRNVYFAGDRILVGLHDGGRWSLAALGQLRFHQYERPDRDRSIDGGAVVTIPAGDYRFQGALMTDLTDTHRGVEAELRAFRTWSTGGIAVVPAVAVQRQSAKLTNYYFGTPAYAPGRTTNVAGELTVVATVYEPWVTVATYRFVQHGSGITGSPAVSDRATTTWSVGIGRRF